METNEAIVALRNHLIFGKFTNSGIIDAIHMAIKALERQRWIPCSERLPEDNERCLVVRVGKSTRTPFRGISWFKNGDWWNGIYDDSFEITHWMPMPEPPEEGGNENAAD